jgi:uncharacterized protein (TIGR02145 family)
MKMGFENISFLLIFCVYITILSGCSKEDEEKIALPIITTSSIADTTLTTAVSGGTVTSDGGSDVILRGICWSTHKDPTIKDEKTIEGDSIGSFSSCMRDLDVNKTYYVRAYAVNKAGVGYGNSISFTTPNTIKDIDGNIYHAIKIGTQVWMLENLKVTRFNDGKEIPLVTENDSWTYLSTPGYCYFNNNTANGTTYGAMYNWYAVNTHKLCPRGWHVPTDEEWSTLINYLGGLSAASGKIREAGFTHWLSPNIDANNLSNFTALPGGYRSCNSGGFFRLGENTTCGVRHVIPMAKHGPEQ